MASNVVKELGDEFLNCAVCRSTYSEPKMLPCIHSFCRNCLEQCKMAAQQKGERFGCPICRTTITLPPGGIKALPTNFLLQSLHDKLGEIETKDASGSLTTAKRTLTRKISKTRCSTHTNGLSMYCRTCKVFQCMSCTTSNKHSGHDLVDATEAELDVHETLELQAVLLESVQEHARCGETEDRARRASQRVKREAASAEDAITQRAAEAMERIAAEKTAMLSRLRMTEARKLRLINRVLDSAAETKSRLKEIEASVKEAIKSENSEDVPKTSNLLSQLEELRIELENIELEDSLHGLGLEFEPSAEVSTLIGELRNPASVVEENSNSSAQTTNISQEQPDTNGHVSTANEVESVQEINYTDVGHYEDETQNNGESKELSLEETLDAIVSETLQPTTVLSPTEEYNYTIDHHAWHPPPPPPWHHPPHHHHRPRHHLHHPHHPRHPFVPGSGCHGGMRHGRPFGRRGRCHHPM
ncbi:uncharacterized protein [Apostichopus japonicus]|uniref:uncharacterized protein n=1 Tax=Stichopus japonicus TaxID=307972 RepID=UPI003AB62484